LPPESPSSPAPPYVVIAIAAEEEVVVARQKEAFDTGIAVPRRIACVKGRVDEIHSHPGRCISIAGPVETIAANEDVGPPASVEEVVAKSTHKAVIA
jgi:hypothetical protein